MEIKDLYRGGICEKVLELFPAVSLVFQFVLTSAGLGLLPKLWGHHPSLHFMLPPHPCSVSAPDPAVNISSVCNSWLGHRSEK